MDLIDRYRKGEKRTDKLSEKREKREKEREREKKEREKREKRERKERKGEKKREKMSRVNYYQSAFNSQKEKLNILAEMFEISKSGCGSHIIDHRHYKSSCRS